MREDSLTTRECSVLPGLSDEAGKGTILLVEDEEMVRGLLIEVLLRQGYKVFGCGTPQEGIDTCLEHSREIDLLLTDVVMPGMNGREMTTRILEFLPELKVIFMSGYVDRGLFEDTGITSRFDYLQKPFTLKTLLAKLTDVLSETRPRVQ